VLDLSRFDVAALAGSWRAARPFGHVILDQLVDEPTLAQLCQAIAAEPHWPNRGEIFDMMGSGEPVQQSLLRQFQEGMGSPPMLELVRAVSGKPVQSIDLRSYVYMKGSYLLPHSDCQKQLGRLVAYAYYVWTEGCRGGELELFDVTLENGLVVKTTPATIIEPRANRLVMFDVSPSTLHQVREVLDGARLSLSGWFHA
jgi:hypothetical protein